MGFKLFCPFTSALHQQTLGLLLSTQDTAPYEKNTALSPWYELACTWIPVLCGNIKCFYWGIWDLNSGTVLKINRRTWLLWERSIKELCSQKIWIPSSPKITLLKKYLQRNVIRLLPLFLSTAQNGFLSPERVSWANLASESQTDWSLGYLTTLFQIYGLHSVECRALQLLGMAGEKVTVEVCFKIPPYFMSKRSEENEAALSQKTWFRDP